MPNRTNNLFRSFELLNSVLAAVVLTYICDLCFTLLQPGLPFIWMIAIPVKVIVLSAFYGTLTEMVTGESLFITRKSLKNNITALWPLTLGFTALVPAGRLLLALLTGTASESSGDELAVVLNVVVLALLAYGMIHRKYLKHLPAVKRPVRLTAADVAGIFLLFGGHAFLYFLPRMTPVPDGSAVNVLVFAAVYLNFLTFIFFAGLLAGQNPDIARPFTEGRELLIINPQSTGMFRSFFRSLIELYPSVIGILYAMTPKDYRVRVINHIVFRRRFFSGGKLVAITCYTPNCHEAYWIAKKFKACGSKVVMGGPHVSTLPDEALQFCDSVVIGEVESVWEDVIRDYESGALKEKYFGEPLADFSQKWHKQMLGIPAEIIRDSIETARGCKFNCEFCTSPYLAGRTIRPRPVEEIVETIRSIRDQYDTIYFNDADIFANPKHAKELFRALIPLKIKWKSHCVLNIAKDDEALDLARQSGCFYLAIGLETNNPQEPKRQGGKFLMQGNYRHYIQKIRVRGIKVFPLFIYGFESDTPLSAVKTVLFALRMLSFRMTLSHLTPFPGTRLYFNLLDQKRLTNLNWRRYDLRHFVFRQKSS